MMLKIKKKEKKTARSIHDSLDIWDTNDEPVVVSAFKKDDNKVLNDGENSISTYPRTVLCRALVLVSLNMNVAGRREPSSRWA